MAKNDVIQVADRTWTRAEWNQMLSTAKQAGDAEWRRWPQASSVRYDSATQRVLVELTNGVRLDIPVAKLQWICDATESERADVRTFADGTVLEWSQLDQHFTVAGLLSGVFGSQAWMVKLTRQTPRRRSPLRAGMSRRVPAKSKRRRKSVAS